MHADGVGYCRKRLLSEDGKFGADWNRIPRASDGWSRPSRAAEIEEESIETPRNIPGVCVAAVAGLRDRRAWSLAAADVLDSELREFTTETFA